MKPPLFWFRPPDAPGLLPRLLSPLSRLWQWADARRWQNGAHTRLPVPVICVGNINMGGTGKTPTVIAIVTLLQDQGIAPHVVTKGYKGSLTGPVQVDPTKHTADQTGDEPLLLSAFAPCWVAKDRAAGAQAAIRAGAQAIVLDDGMQNPALHKDLTVMVVDAEIGFGNGRVFPAGPLRQTVSEGAQRADVIQFIGRPKSIDRQRVQWPELAEKPTSTGQITPLQTGLDWTGLRALAFAGIGRPAKFFDTLRSLGADVVQTRSFGDHEVLSDTAMRRLLAEAKTLNAQLVATEKDAVRLPDAFRSEVLTLPVRLTLDDPEPLAQALSRLIVK